MNILIRTSNRPNYFNNCVNSIKKFYPTAHLHITTDNENDIVYINKYANGLKYSVYNIDKNQVIEYCKSIPIKRKPFIYNHYFNVIKPNLNGWCLILDDDDELLITPEFENNLNNIYLYKADVGLKIVPSEINFGKEPVLCDISSLCIVFHSSQMIDWTPQRGGDYFFISELYKKYNSIWINKVLSKSQTGGNNGKRNDLKN